MPVERIRSEGIVVLGPCPGCFIWTLEYAYDDHPTEGLLTAVERCLEEHLEECPGLQEIVRSML